MYRIEGDGTYQRTIIWRDNEQISYEYCMFKITPNECIADVDGIEGKIDRMVLSGIYLIISDGDFTNSKVIFCDEMLRGVQALVGQIKVNHHPVLALDIIMLPHIIEEEPEVPPIKVDKRLETFAEEKPKRIKKKENV